MPANPQIAAVLKAATDKLDGKKVEQPEAPVQKKAAKDERFRFSCVTNLSLWQEFTAINKKMSVTNNSCVNLLIARYVQENKQMLEE